MRTQASVAEAEVVKGFRIVRLSDLADILETYNEVCSPLEVILSNPGIRRLEKLFKRIKNYAKSEGLSGKNLWLNDNLTHEYIDIIFSTELQKDKTALDAVFSNRHRIACVNHVFEFLRDMEMLGQQGILNDFAECSDMKRLCHALQKIKSSRIYLSQSEIRFILANHQAAVSIANCFIMFQQHDYTQYLISALVKNFDMNKGAFIKDERLVYDRGPGLHDSVGGSYLLGLVAALDRLTLNKVKLSIVDFMFLMRHHDEAMSIAASYILLKNSKTENPRPLFDLFRDNYNKKLSDSVARFEMSVIQNSTPDCQVINGYKSAGLVAALWRLHHVERIFSPKVLCSLENNPDYCEQLSSSLVLLDGKMPKKMEIHGLVEVLCDHPDKSLDLAAIMIALHENGFDCDYDDGMTAITTTKMACLRTILVDILNVVDRPITKNGKRNSLCTLENYIKLKDVIGNIEAINILLLHLFRMRKSDDCDSRVWKKSDLLSRTYLDQEIFDKVISVSRFADGYSGLDELIDSEKFLPEDLLKLLDHPYCASLLISAMKKISEMPVENMPGLIEKLFVNKLLANLIADKICESTLPLTESNINQIVRDVCAANPPPDLNLHPFPYVLTGWDDSGSDNISTEPYSPRFFGRISLGNSPSSSRRQSDEAENTTINATP